MSAISKVSSVLRRGSFFQRLALVLSLLIGPAVVGLSDSASAATGQSSVCDSNHMCLSKYALAQGAGTGMVGYKYNTFGTTANLAWSIGSSTFIGGGSVQFAASGRNRDAYQQRRMCLYRFVADSGYFFVTGVGYSYAGWFGVPGAISRVDAYYASSCPAV